MGSFEINSAELGTIISQYQRIGRDLSNYSGRIRREVQRLNSQKGFGIETVRNNLTHLSSNSNAHSRDVYIFGGFLKDLETESTNAENQVSKGMYSAAPTKMSLTQLVAGALAILVGFVFSKPLIAPIAAWLAALIKNAPGCKFPAGLPTPGLTPKPAFPPVSEPIVCGNGIGITGEPVLIPPITGGDPSTIGGVIGGAAVGGAVAGGMAGGTTGVAEEPAPAKPETPQVPEPTIDSDSGNIDNKVRLEDGRVIDRDDLEAGDRIARDGEYFRGSGMQFEKYHGQCTWFVAARVQEITGKKINFRNDSGNHGGLWADGIGTDTSRIVNGAKTEIPKPGTIMVSAPTEDNKHGHVLVIEKVEQTIDAAGKVDYKVWYSHANASGNNGKKGYSAENSETDGIVVSKSFKDISNKYTFVDLV